MSYTTLEYLRWKINNQIAKISSRYKSTLIESNFIMQVKFAGFRIFITNNIYEITGLLNKKPFTFKLPVNTSDSLAFGQVFINHEYERIVQICKDKKLSPEYIIDCGSNVGFTSVYFTHFFPDAKIIAIEPDHANYERQQSNFTSNGCLNIISLNKAIWHKSCIMYPGNDFRDAKEWSRTFTDIETNCDDEIEAVTIPELIDNYNLPYIDILKIDIEGAEEHLFNCLISDLSFLNKVKIICLEIHSEVIEASHIEDILVSFGFTISHQGELTIGVK